MNRFPYAFGIEEEFFVSCPQTGALVNCEGPELVSVARRKLGSAVACEMLQSQIEIVSPIFQHVAEADLVMRELRRSLADVVDEMGWCLIAAGTHPLGVWHEQRVTSSAHYEKLMQYFQIVGQRNLVCGLHVHVAVPQGVDRIRVMNRALRWVPLFLALSTSSPFWNGRATGLLSYRQTLYDEWPRSGLPDFFESECDYNAFVTRLRDTEAIRDASQLWWAIRPAANFPTLELRVTDACTRVEDSLAIAALFRCLVAALVDDPNLGAQRTTHTRRIVDENRWRAKRDGISARFIAQASSSEIAVVDMLHETLAILSDQIEHLECGQTLETLRDILDRGTSAHEQLRIYDERRLRGDAPDKALKAVLKWLEHASVT
jgi:glutamate---cysteine ligase / carboxylate-amine ligase